MVCRVKLLAQLGAGAHGARTGALSRSDAVAALKKYLQVQVAMTAWKAGAAQLLLQRVISFCGQIGGNSEAPLHIQGFWISG